MSRNRLGKEDLDELKERIKIFNQQKLVLKALELHNKVWLDAKIAEKGLPRGHAYDVMLKTGNIVAIEKPEEKERQEDKKDGLEGT